MRSASIACAFLVLLLISPGFAPAVTIGPGQTAHGRPQYPDKAVLLDMVRTLAHQLGPGNALTIGPGTSSRGTLPVNIHGTLSNASGTRPPLALVAALDVSTFALVNSTMTTTGDYSFDVWNTTTYILFAISVNGDTVGDYGLHGYAPIGRSVQVETPRFSRTSS